MANPWGDTWPDTRPPQNWIEDTRMSTYRERPSTLEVTLERNVKERWVKREAYTRVPLDLLSIPRRLLTGAPLIERYVWEAVIYEPKVEHADG